MPHKGAGSAVFEAAMKWATDHGAGRLFILSNSKLGATLHIYEKHGFKEIKFDDYDKMSHECFLPEISRRMCGVG